MKINPRESPIGGGVTPEQIATFVVVESGTCQIPALSPRQTNGLRSSTDYDSDYMPEVYSYPLYDDEKEERTGKIVNMRVDIKMRVHTNNAGSVAPPSTPANGLLRPQGGAIAPPSSPTNSSNNLNGNGNNYDSQDHLGDVIDDNYATYARNSKIYLRHRSAPPVMSQYRTRLTNTSQWVKKRAVAELTSSRKNSKMGRPSTSVRPFSERECQEASNSHMTRVCIQPPPQPSRISIPDFGSFRGKPPISVPTRSARQRSQTRTPKDKPRVGDKESEESLQSSSRNKIEQYVSELRKSIKTKKPSGRRRLTPFAVWAISNSDEGSSVSPELERFEGEARQREITIDRSPTPSRSFHQSKANDMHSVRRQIIKQLSDSGEEKENKKRRNILEVKGDIPPGVPTTLLGEYGQDQKPRPIENEQNLPATKSFPRSKTTLSTAAQKGTLRYARQIANKNAVQPVKILDRDIFQSSNPINSGFAVLNDPNTLPSLNLRHTMSNYKAYKQNAAPFVRTLI